MVNIAIAESAYAYGIGVIYDGFALNTGGIVCRQMI
jgi:hypothetical protein